MIQIHDLLMITPEPEIKFSVVAQRIEEGDL
jgi:hypothetical protein